MIRYDVTGTLVKIREWSPDDGGTIRFARVKVEGEQAAREYVVAEKVNGQLPDVGTGEQTTFHIEEDLRAQPGKNREGKAIVYFKPAPRIVSCSPSKKAA
jgi:hypothetical protein